MNSYRLRENASSSDSDSDSPSSFKPKTMPNKRHAGHTVMDLDIKPLPSATESSASLAKPPKRKVNNIWASVAQEQSINEDLSQFNMKKLEKTGFDRGCEEYDFTRKDIDTRPEPESDDEIDLDYGVSDIENEFESSEQAVQAKDNKKKKEPKINFQEKLEDAEKIGREVANKLHEPKPELIMRSVLVLGRKKVFDLLHMTEDIENSGGLLILNGTRRRTPGGVFLFQLRKDKQITSKLKTYIFAEERAKANYNARKSHIKMLKKKEPKKNRPKVVQMHIDICDSDPSTAETKPDPVLQMEPFSKSADVKVEETICEELPEVNPVADPSLDVDLEDGEIL